MKRSNAPSVLAGGASQTVTTTVVKKAKTVPSKAKPFGPPRWVGKLKTGFPKELRIKHRYVAYKTLTSTTGALGSQTFRCNGMFDPDHTSTGHQPLYFDQLAALYNHFTVLNSKITVKLTAGTANSAVPMQVAMYVNDDTTVTPSGIEIQAEQSTGRFGMVPVQGNGTLVLTSKWSAKENFGPYAISDPNLQGSSAADPTEQQTWSFQYQAADLASTVVVYAQFVIEYDAIWQELKDIGTS